MEKPKPAPVTVTPLMVVLISPVFCKVTVCVPVTWRLRFPKLMEAGESCKAAKALCPTPARETAAGEEVALELICRDAERLPVLVGTKETVKETLWEGSTV